MPKQFEYFSIEIEVESDGEGKLVGASDEHIKDIMAVLEVLGKAVPIRWTHTVWLPDHEKKNQD